MVLVLKAELRNRKRNESIFIGFKPIPLNKNIEQSHGEGKSCPEIIPYPVANFLEMRDYSEHRKYGFENHPYIPCSPLTGFHICRVTFFGMKSRVGKDDHFFIKLLNKRMKDSIIDISCITVPGNDESPLVYNKAELSSDDPSVVGLSFSSNLPWTSSLSYGMDELNTSKRSGNPIFRVNQ